jgi:hypothetical protein
MDNSNFISERWMTYEANVQAYRSNFLSSQSILLAVGAIVLGKSLILTIIISAIGIFQMWLIWYGVIAIRTRIVDYYKYSMSLGINKLFDNKGNLVSSNVPCSEYLNENTYATNAGIRDKINEYISKNWERKTKFSNNRTTRVKLDIILPVSITFIWAVFIFYDVLVKILK